MVAILGMLAALCRTGFIVLSNGKPISVAMPTWQTIAVPVLIILGLFAAGRTPPKQNRIPESLGCKPYLVAVVMNSLMSLSTCKSPSRIETPTTSRCANLVDHFGDRYRRTEFDRDVTQPHILHPIGKIFDAQIVDALADGTDHHTTFFASICGIHPCYLPQRSQGTQRKSCHSARRISLCPLWLNVIPTPTCRADRRHQSCGARARFAWGA